MFRSFFLNRAWAVWSWLGMAVIVGGTWYQVEVDVQINEWFGGFYDMVQKALGEPGSISLDEFYGFLFTFARIAGIYIVIAVLLSFFTKHWVFRWRQAMNNFYMENWQKLRHIEGASQRVQEDTRRFATIMESLGSSLLDSLMTLIAFLPILWELSKPIKELPGIGEVEHALVYVAVIFALFGTAVLAAVGIKLPGLEFNNQKVEASYRKELVYGEDDAARADPPTVQELFHHVRKNYFRLFFHYMYFDVAKWSYLQFGVLVPYIALAPTIVAGALTLGVMQQIVRAFGRVESSFQFLVRSWGTIVELISVYKRLRAFEAEIYKDDPRDELARQQV
ncbi:peptide antibiotic transporter SbmA [Rhodospirillaceae bacterium KN72]|uniref:Peptide antibiotic transporter SbmA n=1 Tax=Pacificispira spongiicola TaxID=2729598 RepID=A0A7Y0E3L6_9PROT|nr:peptide antibiotic transporter SbmA [Pacificispira spongiicola]NMM46533.1 peptide antibiotic transporter SbmA [Pacificispira spongiicola]